MQDPVSAGEKDVYWALAKCKKGHSTIDEELWPLLVAAFSDHPNSIKKRLGQNHMNSAIAHLSCTFCLLLCFVMGGSPT